MGMNVRLVAKFTYPQLAHKVLSSSGVGLHDEPF